MVGGSVTHILHLCRSAFSRAVQQQTQKVHRVQAITVAISAGVSMKAFALQTYILIDSMWASERDLFSQLRVISFCCQKSACDNTDLKFSMDSKDAVFFFLSKNSSVRVPILHTHTPSEFVSVLRSSILKKNTDWRRFLCSGDQSGHRFSWTPSTRALISVEAARFTRWSKQVPTLNFPFFFLSKDFCKSSFFAIANKTDQPTLFGSIEQNPAAAGFFFLCNTKYRQFSKWK